MDGCTEFIISNPPEAVNSTRLHPRVCLSKPAISALILVGVIIVITMFRSESPAAGSSAKNILGFNIDGERLLLVYGNPSGLVYESLATPTPRGASFQTVLEILADQADRLLSIVQAQHLPIPVRLSAAISGDYQAQTGIVDSAADFPDWRNVPLKSQLELRFNLPVFIAQRADAGALAESLFGQGQNVRNLVFISLKPVVRAGILSGGRLYQGENGNSGKIGNLILSPAGPAGLGRAGSLNGYVSATGMLELARLRHPSHWDEDVTIEKIIQAAQEGDPFATEVVEESGHQLGLGLVGTVLLLRPDLIVIGHPGCLLGDLLTRPARNALAEATGLAENQLPRLAHSLLGNRLPELQALAPAIFAARNP